MRVRRGAGTVPVAALVLLILVACGGGGHQSASLTWRASGSLPAPHGSRAVARAATYCGGSWYVVGAAETPSSTTRPAVWRSSDARHWQAVRLDPGGDYYAAQEILYSVGCSRGRIAVLGAKPGGAHGMPRTATWHQRQDGSLVANRAPFVLYGGVHSVQVVRLAGGPRGWLISGTRTTGAAVWRSSDGRTFRIEEDVPGLADSRQVTTQGFDAASDAGRWWVVGTAVDGSGTESATSWTRSGPGRWTAHPIASGAPIATAEVVVAGPQGPIAVGLDGSRFAAWTHTGGSWARTTTFGEQDSTATEASYVAALATTGHEIAVSYSDGAHFRLAVGPTTGPWVDTAVPESVPVSGDRQLAIAGGGDRFLLLADDGAGTRVWVASGPAS